MKLLTVRRTALNLLAGLALAGVAGCDSIGDGNTIVSLEIQSIAGETTNPYMLTRCLRDQLIAVATFADGTRAQYNSRATWTSDNPSVVLVSNSDIRSRLVDGGEFRDSQFNLASGVLVPQAASGTANITASFLGFTATRQVQIYTPEFKIAPLGQGVDPQVQPPAKRNLLPTTTLRYTFFIETDTGRTVQSPDLISLNPVLWRFVGATVADNFIATDPAVAGDFDKFVMPSKTSPTININAVNGLVTGVAADTAEYTVEAVTSLCPDDDAFKPKAPVQVSNFATSDPTLPDPADFVPLELRHEADFNGPGVTTGDLIGGTTETLQVIAHLDGDGDGEADATQDISASSAVKVDGFTACTSGTVNCTCDTDGSNCGKRLLANNANFLVSLSATDFTEASVTACFKPNTSDNTTHFDDCTDTAPTLSNVLTVRNVPVDLTAAVGPLFVDPLPAPQRAFTYPGRQFNTYGTFTANTAQKFAGNLDTGTQKLNRWILWATRPQGSTTELSDLGFVANAGDGFFGTVGSFFYLKDVESDTVVDNYMTTVSPFNEIDPPAAPVQFTICPSMATSCPGP